MPGLRAYVLSSAYVRSFGAPHPLCYGYSNYERLVGAKCRGLCPTTHVRAFLRRSAPTLLRLLQITKLTLFVSNFFSQTDTCNTRKNVWTQDWYSRMAHGLDKSSWILVLYYRVFVAVFPCLDPNLVQQKLVQFRCVLLAERALALLFRSVA